eukprot:1391784-Pyramimonas_sp.AAC.1
MGSSPEMPLRVKYALIGLNTDVKPLFIISLFFRCLTSRGLDISNFPPASRAPYLRAESSHVHVSAKPRSRLSAGQWQSIGREYTSNIRWNIRNAAR